MIDFKGLLDGQKFLHPKNDKLSVKLNVVRLIYTSLKYIFLFQGFSFGLRT